jgi:hypothetical protein
LKAVIGDDTLDAAQADGEVILAQPLGNDAGGGVRVEEAVSQDQADGLVCAAVIGSGPGFLGLEGRQPPLLIVGQELIIALAAQAILLGQARDVWLKALALQKHEEARGRQVFGVDGHGAGRAGNLAGLRVKVQRVAHWSRL